MAYSIVRTTLSYVERPSHEQIKLIEAKPRVGTELWRKQQFYFGYLRQHGYWIACKCNRKALIHVKSGKNYYYLFSRVSEIRHAHEDSCAFKASINTESSSTKSIAKIQSTEYDFFKRITGDVSKQESDIDRIRNNVYRQSKLFTLLRHISKLASLHCVLNGKRDTFIEHKDKFLAAAKGITLGGVTLDKVTFFQLDNSHTHIARQRLFATAFNKGHEKVALMIWISDTYELKNDELRFEFSSGKKMILKECRVHLHHARGDNKDGPFLIAALYRFGKNKEGENAFSYPIAYVVPIASKVCWMFCDSSHEREMANALINFSEIEHTQTNATILVIKPIEALEGVGEGNIVPDFDISVNASRCFIEVMGFNTDDYIERKKRTIREMEKVAPVNEFIAYRFKPNKERKDTMFKYAVKIIRGLNQHD